MRVRTVAIPTNAMLRHNTGVHPGYLMRTVLELFTDEQRQTQKRDHLIGAIDTIRHRFGNEAVQVGRTMAA